MKLGENGDTSLSPMGSLQRVVIWMKDGQEMEVYDNPKTYDINYAPRMTKDDIMAKNNIFLPNICVIQNFEVSLHSQ